MLPAAARIFVSLWLLGSAMAAAAETVPQATGALEITLKASEAAGAPAGEKVKLYSASKALVIGIDNYSAGWPRLSGAIKDAKAVAEALKLQGFQVTVIADPTAAGLRQAFDEFFITAGADPDARLFVWFAGHGHTIKSGGGDDEGYIVPSDAPSPLVSDTEFRLKAISLRRFGEYMREARAKHVLAVFDSCFGGSVFNVARALPPPAITRATALPVRQFISSGDADQEVGDDGTFRKLFIDALQGAEPSADINKDGYLTGTGLGQFLYNKMTNLTEQRQTPRYGKLNALGYDRGDFVFQVREPNQAAAVVKPPQDTPQVRLSEAARAWEKIKDRNDIAVFRAFRKQYGVASPLHGEFAEGRIAELNRLKEVWGPIPAPAIAVQGCVWLGKGGLCFKPGSGIGFKDCDLCPEMVIVPAGSFTMGSPDLEPERSLDEGPLHRVTIPKAFAVSRSSVTFAEWEAYVADPGSWGGPASDDGGWGRGERPAINISWYEAQSYVKWLSNKTGKSYRLLSEAEFEWVARAATTTPYWWGTSITPDQANYNGSADPYSGGGKKGAYRQMTLPVKSFQPNPWGLYQVHGNVATWTQDCWKDSYTDTPKDGSAESAGECARRVIRGGSWSSTAPQLRAAQRGWTFPDYRRAEIGFRVARTLD